MEPLFVRPGDGKTISPIGGDQSFFKADGIITCVEPNRRDANHRPLAENLERLRSFRTPAGSSSNTT